MITVAVAGTLAAIAVPNMRDFMRNNRLSSAANDMLRSVQVARSEAVKRQQIVATCASADPNADQPDVQRRRLDRLDRLPRREQQLEPR